MTIPTNKTLGSASSILRMAASAVFGGGLRQNIRSLPKRRRFRSVLECLETRQLLSAGTELTARASFDSEGDGWLYPSTLVADSKGDLFGTTEFGGITSGLYSDGAGTVFEVPANSDKVEHTR